MYSIAYYVCWSDVAYQIAAVTVVALFSGGLLRRTFSSTSFLFLRIPSGADGHLACPGYETFLCDPFKKIYFTSLSVLRFHLPTRLLALLFPFINSNHK